MFWETTVPSCLGSLCSPVGEGCAKGTKPAVTSGRGSLDCSGHHVKKETRTVHTGRTSALPQFHPPPGSDDDVTGMTTALRFALYIFEVCMLPLL